MITSHKQEKSTNDAFFESIKKIFYVITLKDK